MKKNYFLMLLALVFLVFSCRSEDLADTQDKFTAGHSSKNYASLNKFLQVTGISKEELYKDISSAKGKSSPEDFEINTDRILETIKNQQITAFSFIVYPKNGSIVEIENGNEIFYNMAFVKVDNVWQKSVYKYTVPAGWLSSLQTTPNAPFNGNITRVYPSSESARAYICGFSATPAFHCWAGHTDPNDGDCGDCWHWNTTSIWCDDTTAGGPDHPTNGGTIGIGDGGSNESGFQTNLPMADEQAMMIQKYAAFVSSFNLNSYGFSTELKTKLFHLYLTVWEDDYVINQLLSASPSGSPQKANLLNWAIDHFNENLSTTSADELTTSTKSFLNWGSNFFIQNPTIAWPQFRAWFIEPITQQDIINELQGYPCAQSIVQQLPNLSNDIATAMKNVFQNNENYNIIFKAKSGLGDVDGETFVSRSNTGSFRAVIYLNDQVLTKGTKEYILVTMYHEVVHAFLDYERFRLGDLAFNNQYPSVLVGYDYDGNGHIINKYTFLPNHSQLGAFLSQLENIISTYNPNLPLATVKAIAKAGITTITPQEKQLNINERDTTTNNHKGTKCQ